MRVNGLSGTASVFTDTELQDALSRRFDGRMELFELTHDPLKHPILRIQVNGDRACLHYSPRERDAGFVSVASSSLLNPGEITRFPLNVTGECDETENYYVVSFPDALEAAKEFLRDDKLPSSIRWFEL